MNNNDKIIEQLAIRIANLEIEKAQAIVNVNELERQLDELNQKSEK